MLEDLLKKVLAQIAEARNTPEPSEALIKKLDELCKAAEAEKMPHIFGLGPHTRVQGKGMDVVTQLGVILNTLHEDFGLEELHIILHKLLASIKAFDEIKKARKAMEKEQEN